MEPRAPMPWRVLESPPLGDDDQGPPAAMEQKSGAGTQHAPSVAPRVLAIAAGALICAIVAFVLATGTGTGTVQVEGDSGFGSGLAGASSDGVPGGGELVVEIVGAVRQPGVYRLPRGSRVGDLLTAAGGYGPRVDTSRSEQELNLAAALADGAQIRVPSRDDTSSTGAGTAGTSRGTPSGAAKVDLNHATQAELEALPGIGPATAQKILAARAEAPFATIDELRSRGILGEKTFEKLRDLVTVG
jgi:competence protein ComEA